MIDIVIPLMHNGSKYDNLELKYCLRSIEKHLSGFGNIIIIGEKPSWIKNVIHVPYEDNKDNKRYAENICKKILSVINVVKFKWITYECDYDKTGLVSKYKDHEHILTDKFLFVNDDHFLLNDYLAEEFPYYHGGEMDIAKYRNNNGQYRQISNTVHHFIMNSYTEHKWFDIHCPIIYNKERFRYIFNSLEWPWPDYGYCIKSIYANRMNDIKTEFAEDLKISERVFMKESIYRVLEGRNWFSIGDKTLLPESKMPEVLEELYPEKSNYER